MNLFKLDLMSKHNKELNRFLYMPIVEINGKYYRCQSIKSNCILKRKDIDINKLILTTEIKPEFYSANNIK